MPCHYYITTDLLNTIIIAISQLISNVCLKINFLYNTTKKIYVCTVNPFSFKIRSWKINRKSRYICIVTKHGRLKMEDYIYIKKTSHIIFLHNLLKKAYSILYSYYVYMYIVYIVNEANWLRGEDCLMILNCDIRCSNSNMYIPFEWWKSTNTKTKKNQENLL